MYKKQKADNMIFIMPGEQMANKTEKMKYFWL